MSTSPITYRERGAVSALVAVGAFFAVLVIVAVSLFAWANGIQKEMIDRETALTAEFKTNQTELSQYTLAIKEAVGIADRGTDALDKVLKDAIRGRYDGDTSAQPGGGALFSAITEAYPDLTANTAMYAKVQDEIISGRKAFKNKQNALSDKIRAYDKWRTSGFIHSAVTSMVGAPSDALRVTIDGNVTTGKAALDKMDQQVNSSESNEAFKSGVDNGLDLGPTPQASPTK